MRYKWFSWTMQNKHTSPSASRTLKNCTTGLRTSTLPEEVAPGGLHFLPSPSGRAPWPPTPAASRPVPWACDDGGNGRAGGGVRPAPFRTPGKVQHGGGRLRGPAGPRRSSRCEADAPVRAPSPGEGRRSQRGALPAPPGRLRGSPGRPGRPPHSPRPAEGRRGRAASAPAPPPRRQRAA